ncbi:MAG: murein biosynthesis integral membrane protein MurJ [Chloroflexi bacterium]|nr:murein biosynthesis integral membrane protein MurJ [Chloroflexota bacterium]
MNSQPPDPVRPEAFAGPASSSSPLRQTLTAALIVAAGFAASKVLGLLRNVVIGHQYGADHDYEMFLAALLVPDTLFQVLAGGAVGSAFIPVFAGSLARHDRDGAWRLTSSLANLGLITLGGSAVIIALVAPALVAAIVPGWSPGDQARTANLMRLMLAAPALFALGTLATSTLNAMNRFALAAAAPLAYNLSLVAGATLLRPLGVEGLALSAVAGALLHVVVQVPGLIAVGLRYRPVLGLRLSETREVIALMGPRMIGLGVSQLNQVVTVALASFLSEGSIAYLSYAWLVLMVPLGIAAMGVATAIFPGMSRAVADGRPDEARATFRFGLGLVVMISLVSMVGLIVLGRPMVGLLLERGAFGPEATVATAFALTAYAVGLPGHSTIEVASRAFYAARDTATPVRIAAVGATLNLVLSLALMRTPLSYAGLALANGIAALTEAILLVIMLQRRLGWLSPREVLSFARPALLVTLAFAGGCVLGEVLALRIVSGPGWTVQAAVLLAGGFLGAVFALTTMIATGWRRSWLAPIRMALRRSAAIGGHSAKRGV